MLDQYFTPTTAVQSLLEELRPFIVDRATVYDPAAGSGQLVLAATKVYPNAIVAGMEIDDSLCNEVIVHGDFLSNIELPTPTLYLSNPPYFRALPFMRKMVAQGGMVAGLLRLSFLASKTRYLWWKANPPSAIRILSKRPSFTGDGRTDNSEYAWFLWNVPIRPLDWYL